MKYTLIVLSLVCSQTDLAMDNNQLSRNKRPLAHMTEENYDLGILNNDAMVGNNNGNFWDNNQDLFDNNVIPLDFAAMFDCEYQNRSQEIDFNNNNVADRDDDDDDDNAHQIQQQEQPRELLAMIATAANISQYNNVANRNNNAARQIITQCKFPGCGVACTSPDALRTHVADKHSAQAKHVCTHCGRICTCPSALSTHLRIHTGARPFQCSICTKGFPQLVHLKYHEEHVHKLTNSNNNVADRGDDDNATRHTP